MEISKSLARYLGVGIRRIMIAMMMVRDNAFESMGEEVEA